MPTVERTNGTTLRSEGRRPFAIVPAASFSALSRWTVATVRAALDEHESGSFATSALLAEAVVRDPAIFSALQMRATALSSKAGLPFAVEPSEGVDDRRAASIANDVEDLWWTIAPETEVAAIQRDAIMLGVAVWRDDGSFVEGEWVPRMRRLRPHGLRWSDYENCYRYIGADGIDHVVTPGVSGWGLHAPHGGDSWMFGAIRALGIPWIGGVGAIRDWFRSSEKHGMPALAVEEPFNAADDVEGSDGATSSQASSFYADLRKLPQESLIRLPQPDSKDVPGWKAYWLELRATYDGFQKLVTELRRQVTSVLLGRDPDAAGSKVGGDGASLLERVRGEYLAADAEGLSTAIREQVLKPWIVRSYDPTRPELAPWPCWDTRPPVDLAERAKVLLTLSTALPGLRAEGVDVEPILEEFHLRRSGPPMAPAAPAAPKAPIKGRFAAYRGKTFLRAAA